MSERIVGPSIDACMLQFRVQLHTVGQIVDMIVPQIVEEIVACFLPCHTAFTLVLRRTPQ